MASKPRITKAYTLGFAATVTIVCSVLLASAAALLKERQDTNIKVDIKWNILSVLDLVDSKDVSTEHVFELYESNINSFVVDPDGNRVEGEIAEEIDPKAKPGLLPVFAKQDGDSVLAYCIPIQGKALWSTVKGYLALENDLNTVKGITFYSHGETPGLGGEIDKEWFKDGFEGKTILDESGNLVSIKIVKGKLREGESDLEHKVDGISGATLTTKGLNEFIKETLEKYEPYFDRVRGATS
ncbi:MAG: NADH:ubiquinone reductase (Na(+)-transporting) subunit C [Candidatus Marinimicrobia bacterium]|nr:NADH:ubiquinone reductase (Na(+)-transporting) subunit C [Candidatus Neomarinimicrobiota bacterium]MCF7851174.1 NADH:ubiquinone reductase (Na(+)-transporting) subunit C [Candidatus Neomarinimicrobiota bacterium]MCF7904243.1 NADH:ubiquinone reductase (Na(+)-transporting) subunit C [Candidatus Neomarinimicrobiota bacterium]